MLFNRKAFDSSIGVVVARLEELAVEAPRMGSFTECTERYRTRQRFATNGSRDRKPRIRRVRAAGAGRYPRFSVRPLAGRYSFGGWTSIRRRRI